VRSKWDSEDAAPSERRDGGPSYYERAIRTTIGRGLRSYYDLSEPIPERMQKLLEQIDQKSKLNGHQPTERKPEEAPNSATE
jgi:Anti-sigma factor NepR